MNVPFAVLFFGCITVAPVLSSPLILTPYILKNKTELARNLSAVNSELFLNVSSYSGFFTVDQKYSSNLFFWFFPAENKPLNATPWIIWLQGGPGVSSLAGLFIEMGPLMYENSELKLRETSWTKEYSMLFIDNPVGAGFSYTSSDDGMVKNMNECSNHLYSALQQFLEVFPELRAMPLYLAGESYAGHYVPAFAHRILHPPTLPDFKLRSTSVNLKGLMMGNPLIDRRDQVNLTSVYYQWGLIDPQGVEAVRKTQEQYLKAIQDGDNEKARQSHDDLLNTIEIRAYQKQSYNVLKDALDLSSFQDFVTIPSVMEAIHVERTPFDFSNGPVHFKLIHDYLVSVTPQVEELLEHYRILIYCGQLDIIAPCVLNAEARRKHWHWKGRQDFLKAPRNPWWHANRVAGYVKSGGNFTEVLVRDSGHLVPMDRPSEALKLITSFIENQELPLPGDYNTFASPDLNFADDSVYSQVSDNKGLAASIVLNVLFVLIIVLGVVYVIRWKRRHNTFFYNLADQASLSDGILTMD